MKFLTIFTIQLFLSITVFSQQVSNRNIDNKCVYKPNVFKQTKIQRSIDPLFDNYDVTYYKLNIAMERTSTYISGDVTILAHVTKQALNTFVAELYSTHTVDSVFIDGIKYAFNRTGNLIKVDIPTLSIGTLFNAQIFYHGTPPSGVFFAGMTHDTYSSYHIVWSLSEPCAAYEWWPCKQSLQDKADSADIFVTTSNTNKVGSNGILANTVSLPNNKVRYEWKNRYPIDYYLISVAISNYFEYNIYAKPAGYQDSILIQNYIYNGTTYLNSQRTNINRTKTFIELYSDKFGLYPFHLEKYGHCTAPLGGGMEHQTMTTLSDFNFLLNCHELSHQWFGDNITCSSWQDIWLNEGFATYSEYIAIENILPGNEGNWLSSIHDNIISYPDGSVFVPAADTTDEWRVFEGRLSYDKGGAVLHMIRYIINNDSLFFASLKNYQNAFQFSTASTSDFKNILLSTTGIDFTDFLNQWIYGEGYPIFEVYWNYINNDSIKIICNQTTSTTTTPLFTLPIEFKLISPDGDTIVRVEQTANTNTYYIPIDRTVTDIEIDPSEYLIKDVLGVYLKLNPKDTKENYFEILQNPVNDILALSICKNNYKNYEYLIYNTLGNLISRGTFANEARIDVSNLVKGTYIISIKTSKYISTKKFIKL